MTDYRIKWGGALPGGQRWTTKLEVTSSQTESALLTTAEAFVTDWWSNGTYGVGSQYHSDTTVDQIQVATLNGLMREVTKSVGTIALAGTSSDNPLSDSTTLVVLKRSNGLQRFQRGFMSLPAPVEGVLSGGLYTTTVRNRFGSAAEAVRSAIGADGSTIFVYVGKKGTKEGLVPPYTKTVILKLSASNKPGTRRQRTRSQTPSYS